MKYCLSILALAELMVIAAETEGYVPPNEMHEQPIAEAVGIDGFDSFDYVGIAEGRYGDVLYIYAKGTLTDDGGDYWEGYFGIPENKQIPNQSFLPAIMAPSFSVGKSSIAVQAAIVSLISLLQ